jgi:chromosome segregation ATPase
MSVILFFYQNETSSLDKTIDLWNEKVAALTLKDKEVIGKLDPLKKELADLQTDQKKNKKPIAELKDRISDLEKERKALEQQMSDDSADLSKYLAESCKAVQSSLKERIADIIEEIKYSYQDSFTYKSL